MSNRYQIFVLKGGLAITFFAIKLFGLWPFRFVNCKSQIQYSLLKALYSIFVLLFGTLSYTKIGSIVFSDGNHFFGSFTLRLVGTIYAQTVITSFVLTYLGQHWFAKDIVIAYSKCRDIIMNEIFENVDFSSYLPEIILKTIVIETLQAALSFTNMTNASQLINARPYLAIILMMPSIVVKFHTNIFYVAVVAINVYIKKLNCCLLDIGSKIDCMNEENIKNKCLQVINYCKFSDEIDKLSLLYLKLVQGTKALNTSFSIQIILWNTTLLFALTLQYLYQFITIIEIIHDPNETVLIIIFIGFTAILISLIDLFVTTYACQRIVNTVLFLYFY